MNARNQGTRSSTAVTGALISTLLQSQLFTPVTRPNLRVSTFTNTQDAYARLFDWFVTTLQVSSMFHRARVTFLELPHGPRTLSNINAWAPGILVAINSTLGLFPERRFLQLLIDNLLFNFQRYGPDTTGAYRLRYPLHMRIG